MLLRFDMKTRLSIKLLPKQKSYKNSTLRKVNFSDLQKMSFFGFSFLKGDYIGVKTLAKVIASFP